MFASQIVRRLLPSLSPAHHKRRMGQHQASRRLQLESLEPRLALSHLAVVSEGGTGSWSWTGTYVWSQGDTPGTGSAHDSCEFFPNFGSSGAYSGISAGAGACDIGHLFSVDARVQSYPPGAYSWTHVASASASITGVWKIEPDENENYGDAVEVIVDVVDTSFGTGTFSCTVSGVAPAGQLNKIGDTISVSMSGHAQLSTHNNSEWVEAAGAGYVDAVLRKPPVDIVAEGVEWNAEKGGIDIAYQIVGNLPVPLVAQVAWIGAGGKVLSSFNVQPGLQGPGDHEVNIPAQRLGLPPAGATAVKVTYDPFNAAKELSEGNNASTPLAYAPTITGLTAKYDGDARADVIGRFFKGVAFSGQVFYFTLSESLAAIRPQVTFKVGNAKLAATAESDGVSYHTVSYDKTASLAANTHVRATAALAANGKAVAAADAVLDIVSLPKWFNAIKPYSQQFDPATESYVFSGSFFDFSTNKQTKFTVPDKKGKQTLWLGAKTNNGLEAHADIRVVAGLDPTRQPTATGKANAKLTCLDTTIALKNDLAIAADLNPRTLAINSLTATYHDAGSATKPLFAGTVFHVPPFEIKCDVQADITYSADIILAFKKGTSTTALRLDTAKSRMEFDTTSVVSGTFKMPAGIGLISKNLKKFYDVAKKVKNANPSSWTLGELVDYLADALKDKGLLPNFEASAQLNSTIKLKGAAGISGSLKKLAVSKPSLSGSLVVSLDNADLSFVWPAVLKPVHVTELDLSELGLEYSVTLP